LPHKLTPAALVPPKPGRFPAQPCGKSDLPPEGAMTSAEFATIGFAAPPRERGRRSPFHWIATLALVLAIVIVGTAVSVGRPQACVTMPVTATGPAPAPVPAPVLAPPPVKTVDRVPTQPEQPR
jgi:hypothetical protein